jgi:hypothetical protein
MEEIESGPGFGRDSFEVCSGFVRVLPNKAEAVSNKPRTIPEADPNKSLLV